MGVEVPPEFGQFEKIIGTERFAPYLLTTGGSWTRAARLYVWNIHVSAAVLGAYAALEVGIRNAMHHALIESWRREAWWEVAPLRGNDVMQISTASQYLDRRHGPAQWRAGHIVAELKSSFWEGLLANRYHASLWEAGLKSAFPRYSGRRDSLRLRMERLRLLRNRAAHHEPVHARDLRVDHRYMCELAGFIDEGLCAWITSHSRLPDVIASRADVVAGRVPARF